MTPPIRKRFGQHFLHDATALRRIVELLDPPQGAALLEIGPGRGALTRLLVERLGRIAAVELDRDLVALLRSHFDEQQLALFQADVLELDLAEVRQSLGAPQASPLFVVGNLPYNISKPVASRLVRQREHVERAVLMFQREVADRLCARPGSRSYGPLTVLTGCAFHVERAFDLRPGAFHPPPAVVSSVTTWRRRETNPLGPDEEPRLRACLAASFARRRQTLRRNLSAALGDAARANSLLQQAGIDGGLRAEQLEPEVFRMLASLWERL